MICLRISKSNFQSCYIIVDFTPTNYGKCSSSAMGFPNRILQENIWMMKTSEENWKNFHQSFTYNFGHHTINDNLLCKIGIFQIDFLELVIEDREFECSCPQWCSSQNFIKKIWKTNPNDMTSKIKLWNWYLPIYNIKSMTFLLWSSISYFL